MAPTKLLRDVSVVITIVIFTSMLANDLFYLTPFCSFRYIFEYIHLFIPYRFAVYP